MKRIFFLAFIITCLYSNAQTPDSTVKGGIEFKLSLNYNTGLNYYGRTDSLKSTGIFPLAELWFSPKFYINGSPVFVNNKVQTMQYAGFVTSIGYLNVSDKWVSNLYLLKSFYTESGELVQAALKAQSGANFTALNKLVNVSFGGDVKYSDQLDFGAMAGIDHIFRFENKDNSIIFIDPSFTVNAGTQNFSKTYKRKTRGILLPGQEQVTENYKRFNILSLEAAIPFIYSKKKLQIIAVPAYILPQNMVTVAGRPDLTQTGQNMFYTTIAFKYSF